MPKDSVSSLNVDSDEEGVGQLRTVGFENMNMEDLENEELRRELSGMDKKELTKLITDIGKNELRHVNYQMSVLAERMMHFSKAIEETKKSIEEKSKKAQKYRNMGDDPDRAIKALERIIKNNKLKIKDLQKEVDKFEEKKANKAIEQQNAKKEINKKLTKMAYKFLEKDSDPIIVDLLETFVALLRNRPSAQREDVELYLRKYEGLQVAMNKVNPRQISGGNAAKYTQTIQRIRNAFKEDTEYRKYIPYLVFVNQTCAIVSLTVEERQFEAEIEQLKQDIKDREKEIDEIETFHEHVTEVIDYDEQVEQEQKQLSLFKNQHAVMKMRMDKLTRYSVMFQKYFFRDLKDKSRLRSQKLEYIDVMDDMERVKNLDDKLASIDLAKSVTRIPKDRDENPLGDNKRIKELEKQKSYEGDATDTEAEESKGSDYSGSDTERGEDASHSDSRYKSAVGSESYVSDSRDRSGVSDEEDSYSGSDRV